MASKGYLTVRHVDRSELARIFSKIWIDKSSGCWIWTAGTAAGYGMLRFDGRYELIHRVLYAWLVGPVPKGMDARAEAQLDHVVCDNKRCCNPTHLTLVTQQVNTLRSENPAAINARKSHCVRGHLLPAPNRRGERACAACRAIFDRSDSRLEARRRSDAARYQRKKLAKQLAALG